MSAHSQGSGRLPWQPTTLIGREQELQRALELLRSSDVRMLTITGTAGAGKTRLAIAVAQELAAQTEGAWFVDLAATHEPHQVLPAIRTAFGLREQRHESALARLQRHIGDRQLVLLLDNFEQLLEAARDVANLLSACAHLKVLVTSRAALRVRWEHVLHAAPLAVPDTRQMPPLEILANVPSVSLFVQRAQAVEPSFELTPKNAATIAELCVRLDGLPLAIELSAARMAVSTPAEVLARLASPSSGASSRDLPARQQTLRAAFDWSYDLLPPEDAALFRRLAVFVGGMTNDGALSVCGSDALDTLIQHSLLRREPVESGEPRFRMLETVRLYAMERLVSQHGEYDSVRRAHAEYMLGLAAQAAPELLGPQQAVWLERLELERDNLAAALRWWLEAQEGDGSLRLARSLWRFWWLHGHLSEGLGWLEQVLSAFAEASGELRAPVLNGAGVLAHVLGLYDRALEYLRSALELWRALGAEEGVAAALHNLGSLAREMSDWQGAAAAYEESLALERRIGNRWGIAISLTNLGALARDQGDLPRAEALHTEALALMRAVGDGRGIASTLHNLADVARDAGDWQRAAVLHSESLAAWRQLGDRWSIAVSLLDLGRVRQQLGSVPEAVGLFSESLQLFEELGVRQGTAACLEGLGSTCFASGDVAAAARLLGAAEALREAIGAPLAPRDQPAHERLVRQVRSARAAWRAGRGLSAEQAVAEARRLVEGSGDVLTAREREVVALVSEGLTNRQIAERLVISERTADRHVSNILGKLGLSSRAQIASWAARNG